MYRKFRYLLSFAVVAAGLQFLAGRDEVFLAIDLGVSANLLPPLVGEIAAWGLYAVVFYLFLETYADELAADPRLMAGLSVLTVAYAVVTTRQLGWTQFGTLSRAELVAGMEGEAISTATTLAEFAAVTGVAVAALLTYTKLTYGTAAFDTPLDRLYRRIAPEESVEELRFVRQREGWLGRIGVGLGGLAIVSVALMGTFYLGAVTALVAAFFPLFELLLVGTGLAATATAGSGSGRRRVSAVNVEAHTQNIAQGIFTGFKGFALAPLLFVAFATTLLPVLFGVVDGITNLERLSSAVTTYRTRDQSFVTRWDLLWDVGQFGRSVLALLAGTLMVWYWVRIVRRQPAFLRQWSGDDDAIPPVARPPLVLLPAVLLLVISAVPLAAISASQAGSLEWTTVRRIGWLFAFVWPACAAGAIYWVVRVRRISPASQSIAADRVHVPVAFTVQMAGFPLWMGVAQGWLFELATGTTANVPEYVPQLAVVTLLVVVIAHMPDFLDRVRGSSLSYAGAVPIFVLAAGTVWIGLAEDSAVATVSGAFLLPIGVLQFVLIYARRNQ